MFSDSGERMNKKSLFAQTFTKDELLNRERLIKAESSDISIERINIKRAIDKSIATMKKEIRGYK